VWYEQRSPGLGTEFLAAVDAALAEIVALPERYPVVRGEARRALLRRFPYGVYFVASPELVNVIACLHARRDPRRWQERADADGQGARRRDRSEA
jgi:plasmid stabilization system protein ParE